MINETHDPDLKSWVESANTADTDFPIQNLPVCRFRKDGNEHIGIGIGDSVLDFGRYYETVLSKGGEKADMTTAGDPGIRASIQKALRSDADKTTKKLLSDNLIYKQSDISFLPAFESRDYTDFYCSIYHATNVGKLFRPDNPLLPNYMYVPIGYHGRASSIVVSGTDFKRPHGQNRMDTEKPPVFGPSKLMDYEMEIGFYVGKGNSLGSSVPLNEAENHILGLCLVNDWSARDLQSWEYQPLGPFLGKSFATTVAPFVVTMDALEPFRVPAFDRGDNPPPLDYLSDDINEESGGLDIKLDVYIQTEQMRTEGLEPHLLSRSNLKDLYWTIGQMLAHHTSNGCNLQIGDLIATGTVSGKEDNERACLLEMTKRGTEPVELPSGETRKFLADGDEVIMQAFCEREGYKRIGFGECRGKVLPA